jgi:acyl-CoA oxidase
MERASRIAGQLGTGALSASAAGGAAQKRFGARFSPAPFEVEELTRLLNHDNHELRQRIIDLMDGPLFQRNWKVTMDEHRELTLQRLKYMLQHRVISVRDYHRDPLRFQCALETPSWFDYSLSIKMGVHFTLCGGTIATLGTDKHREVLDKLDTGELGGSFCMTELAHGSNVFGIETTAVFDSERDEFVLNTPHAGAQKFWIGNVALHGKVSTVFAQLYTQGKHQGVHAFIVRIRGDDGSPLPGVRTADNGVKMGLLGVDNGRLWLDQVRVPRGALLDKFAQVDRQGNYSSAIENPTTRFATMIGGLIGGRVLVASSAMIAARVGLTVAIRYAFVRKQFDRVIMSYVTHQRRLFPALAAVVAVTLANGLAKETLHASLHHADRARAAKELHIFVSGLKPYATWLRADVLRACREACGGQGVAAHNLIGPLMSDTEVDVTFEGDNTVLIQQVSKALLQGAAAARDAQTQRGSLRFETRSAKFLLGAFELRAAAKLQKLAAAIQAKQKELAAQGGARSASDAAAAAYELASDLAVGVGVAHVESVILKHFAKVLGDAGLSAALRKALELLFFLYAWTRFEHDAAFFVAEGLAGAKELEAVRAEVLRLCAALYEGHLALHLVDGLGMPERFVTAPIAHVDYVQRHEYGRAL